MIVITCQSEHEYDDAIHEECPKCAAVDAQMHQEMSVEYQQWHRFEEEKLMLGSDPRTLEYWETYM